MLNTHTLIEIYNTQNYIFFSHNVYTFSYYFYIILKFNIVVNIFLLILLQGYDDKPEEMYVSVHDAGAFYRFDSSLRKFVFDRQEVRKGFLQKPKFPEVVHLTEDGYHPVLFAAKGSHGLWTAPG